MRFTAIAVYFILRVNIRQRVLNKKGQHKSIVSGSAFLRGIALLFLYFCSYPLYSIPKEYEGLFSEASLDFRSGSLKEAEEKIGVLFSKSPDDSSILELKALILNKQGKNSEATSTYLKLYHQTNKNNDFSKKRALYAFELGSLYYAAQDFSKASLFLQEAAQSQTNVAAAHFLLGKIAFEQKDLKTSKSYLNKALEDTTFRPSALFLLAKVAFQENRMSDGISTLINANQTAWKTLKSNRVLSETSKQLSRNIIKLSSQELRMFDKSTRFFEVGTSTGYDSNILYVPNTDDASASFSGASFKQSLNWQAQLATSPVRPSQFFGIYQGSIDYNFNESTRGGQFFRHEIATFLTQDLLRNRYIGLKLAGMGVLSYQTDSFRPFSLEGSFGPYTKLRVSDSWWAGAEAFFVPRKNYLDSQFTNSIARSGWDQNLRLYLASALSQKYWNPVFAVTGTLLRPSGSNFRGHRVSLDATNTLYPSSKLFLTQTVGLLGAWFPDREESGPRSDFSFNSALGAGYEFSSQVTVGANLEYLKNLSSDRSFRFDRYALGLSGSYSF